MAAETLLSMEVVHLGSVSSGWDGKDVFESLEANDGTCFLLQEKAEDLE